MRLKINETHLSTSKFENLYKNFQKKLFSVLGTKDKLETKVQSKMLKWISFMFCCYLSYYLKQLKRVFVCVIPTKNFVSYCFPGYNIMFYVITVMIYDNTYP